MTLQDLRILVVDDNANMRSLISAILGSVGVKEVREVSDGTGALDMLREWTPDLLLVDYVMDGVDGIEFTRLVRERFDHPDKRLPIVIITGYSELWRLDEAKKAGADDFLVKPFTARALLSRIHRVALSDPVAGRFPLASTIPN